MAAKSGVPLTSSARRSTRRRIVMLLSSDAACSQAVHAVRDQPIHLHRHQVQIDLPGFSEGSRERRDDASQFAHDPLSFCTAEIIANNTVYYRFAVL